MKRNESTKYDYLGLGGGQVVSSLSTIRVRIPLTSTVFSAKFVFEKNENENKKEAGDGPFKKKDQKQIQ